MSYRYPYGNTEQMNLDWFLKQWETFKAEWAEAEAGIDGSLDAEIAKVEAAMSELYAARDAAAASATAARQSSLDAAAAQVAAGNSKTAAQAAETAARGSQQAAAESAQEAQASATGAENSALTATQAANTATQQAAGADAAKGAAEAAQQAAEAAQAAAAQSAGQAGQAATAAGDHADDAADSATLAQQAAQDMSDSVAQITTNKNDISDLKESIANDVPQKNIINRFNPETITKGSYININTGNLAAFDGFYASDFIYIGDLEKVTVSYTHIFGWYDENKVWLGHPETMNSLTNDLTYDVPENAKYLRFSTYNDSLTLAQIGENISRSNYMEYGYFNIPYLVTDDDEIVVDVNGSGDYTSLTEALFKNVNSKTTIKVKKGTYNLHAEYIAKWGASAVDAMSDADSSTFNGFQFGAIIRNRRVIFESGCFLVCDYTYQSDGVTPQIVDGSHRICALRLDYNAEVYGLNLVATHTFYAIHDDYGTNEYYQNVYENCYIKGVNLTNVNCIGGGAKGKSRHVIKNCYFDNGETGTTVRYHNTNSEGSTPEIYISNCFFSNRFSANYFGPQTSKMRVYVNNCKAKFIVKDRESSSYNVDNVELYKWCNEETG